MVHIKKQRLTDLSGTIFSLVKSVKHDIISLILRLAEVGHRLRLFPMLLNVTNRFPILIQNYEKSKRKMEAAQDLQYEIKK